MEHVYELSLVSSDALTLYYAIVALGAVYILVRFGFSKTTLPIVLVFWEGLFAYLCEVYNFSPNYYKIIIFAYAVILFGPNIFNKKYKQDRLINIAFILFSISFWISYFLYQQTFLTIASQYAYKYGFAFLFYHWIKDIHHKNQKADFLARLLIHIVLLQVAFSIVKVLLIGGVMEFIVGSIQYQGGGVAVAIPILGILVIWLNKKGKGRLKGTDWLIAISVFIIAIASLKRTPVLVLPFVVALLMVYVTKDIQLRRLFSFLPIVPLLFYVGVKTNVSLNPEKSTWGSFDLNYVYSYVMRYNFGTKDIRSIYSYNTAGRGGSLFLLFSPKSLDIRNISELLFGHGLAEVAVAKHGRFLGGTGYSIDHKGGMGTGVRLLYTLGYCGLISYLLFAFAIIRMIKDKRFRLVVIGYYAVEFFLYYNTTLTNNAMSILFVFICLYSNIIFTKITSSRKSEYVFRPESRANA